MERCTHIALIVVTGLFVACCGQERMNRGGATSTVPGSQPRDSENSESANGPGIAATADWFAEQLPTLGVSTLEQQFDEGDRNSIHSKIRHVSLKECVLSWDAQKWTEWDHYVDTSYVDDVIHHVPLKYLDTSSVTVIADDVQMDNGKKLTIPYLVRFRGVGGKKFAHTIYFTNVRDTVAGLHLYGVDTVDQEELSVETQANGGRISKALKHAAVLCGAKASVF
jgi:hypothetical protein